MNNTVELTETHLEPEVLQASSLVVVDFDAPWCGPGKALAPLLDKLAGEYAGHARFATVNVDQAPRLAITLRDHRRAHGDAVLQRADLGHLRRPAHPCALKARLDELAGAGAPAAVPTR